MDDRVRKLARADLDQIAPYVPGKPMQEVQRELGLEAVIKMASNENPLGPSPKVRAAIRGAVREVSRYPEGSAYYLKKELSRTLRVPEEALVVGSGSSEVIFLFLQTFVSPGEEIVFPHPSFLIYKILAHTIGARPVTAPLNDDFSYRMEHLLSAVTQRTKAVILCNPNNPTGTFVSRAQIAWFIQRLPENVLLLSDEAYAEYAESPDFGTALPYLGRGTVLVARTFSKIYALAGLRIGYGITSPEIAALMEKIRPPFNTTGIAQVAAVAALQDAAHVRRSYETNLRGKRYLCAAFARLGVPFVRSEANFILCDLGPDAPLIVRELELRGILVRPVGAFGLPPQYVRVTIGTMRENRAFVSALTELLAGRRR